MINSPSHYLMVINDKIEIMLIIFYFKVLPSLLLIINMQVLLFLFCCFPFFFHLHLGFIGSMVSTIYVFIIKLMKFIIQLKYVFHTYNFTRQCSMIVNLIKVLAWAVVQKWNPRIKKISIIALTILHWKRNPGPLFCFQENRANKRKPFHSYVILHPLLPKKSFKIKIKNPRVN